MIPVVTPEEMGEVDRDAREAGIATEVLVHRAGGAVARTAQEMLGGTYGRRVVVVAGKGNNGADGRDAADRLRREGVRVSVVEAADAPERLPACDLVIDAAYGTGFRFPRSDGAARAPVSRSDGAARAPVSRSDGAARAPGDYRAPDPGGAPVLAVDIPSGVDGLTGEATPGAVWADRTVTFAALKPGLLLHPGADHAGVVTVADIGLDVSRSTIDLVEWADVSGWLPERDPESHKWKSAVWVVAGSPGMTGAAHLCAGAALRAGAGTVRLGIPGSPPDPGAGEVVGRPMPDEGWDEYVLEDSGRAKAMVVGPGLGRDDATGAAVRRLVKATPLPLVIDADGLFALGQADDARHALKGRGAATVLTPHEGEYTRIAGVPPKPDRLAAARGLAAALGATVLLKGSTTLVARPDGRVLVCTAGDSRLATAGTGDVLSGILGAFLARGLDGFEAAAAAALVHGMAGHLGWRHGLIASDLIHLLPAVLSQD